MKKLILLFVVLSGFTFAHFNSQSCCTESSSCEPTTCCPTKPTCCKATKSISVQDLLNDKSDNPKVDGTEKIESNKNKAAIIATTE